MKHRHKIDKRENFTRDVISVDESMREIASLDELYNELLRSKPSDKRELDMKKDEAKFARERILKLSLHIKNLVAKLESHETLK
jgi:hypothetical protein